MHHISNDHIERLCRFVHSSIYFLLCSCAKQEYLNARDQLYSTEIGLSAQLIHVRTRWPQTLVSFAEV